MTDYRAYQDEMLKRMADAMGLTYEQLTGRFNSGRRYGRTWAQEEAQRMANMREINPLPARKPPVSEDVTIEHDPDSGAYWVSLPRRGRLGDRRLFDGETGRPLNIGPTRDAPAPWAKVSDALAHFKRVADAFERL